MPKKTINSDPFDVIPTKGLEKVEVSKLPSTQRFTVHLPVELVNRLKNAAYWTPGMTLSRFCEDAIEKRLASLEKDNGGAFKTRPEELKGGRPIS